jgi:GAG-pre-integrase domain
MEGVSIGKIYTLKQSILNILYKDITKDIEQEKAFMAKVSLQIWHEWFRYINTGRLKQLMDGMAVGIKFSTKESENFQCDVCVLGKTHKVPIYNNSRPKVEKVGQMFHTDMCGPMSVPSINDNRWLYIVVDDVSRLPFPFFMKDKDNAATYNKEYVEMVNTQQLSGVKVQ